MKTRCPCGAVYTIKPEFLGKMTLCKNCGRSFLIEELPSPQPPSEPSPTGHLEPPPGSSETPLSTSPAAGETPAVFPEPDSAPPETALDHSPAPSEPGPWPESAEPAEAVLEEIEPVQVKESGMAEAARAEEIVL